MAGVRDPAFWKRFSRAVHLEEAGQLGAADLKHPDSWLNRQNAKRNRRTWVCWSFWTGFLILVAIVVTVIVWMASTGMLGNFKGSNPNGGTMGGS